MTEEGKQKAHPGLEGISSNEEVLEEKRDNLRDMTTEELNRVLSGVDKATQARAHFAKRVMATLRNLSYSSITGYQNCPFQWYHNYILKERRPSSESQVFGGAVHKVWTDRQVLKARGQSGISLSDLWHSEFGKEVEEREKKFGGVDWGDGSEEETYQEGLQLFDTGDFRADFVSGDWEEKQEYEFAHIETFMDTFPVAMTKSRYDLTPIEPGERGGYPGVERFVELRLPGVPKKLLGFVDWLGAGGIPHDLKTSSRSWYKGRTDSEMQVNLYLAMLLAKAPHVVHPGLIFKHVVLVRNKKHKGQVVTSRRTLGQIKWSLRIVERVWQDMVSGRITPNPQFQWCGKRCDFWDRCLGNEEFEDGGLDGILNAQIISEREESIQ